MKDAALELAYAASDAYRYEAENLAVIDGVLDQLGERAEITPLEFLKLREELHGALRPGVEDGIAAADVGLDRMIHPRAIAERHLVSIARAAGCRTSTGSCS